MEVLILNKKGRKLGAIEMPEKASNVCFAGEKRDVLFITAHTSVYSIRTLVRGVQ
jgi:gluconolactonase